MDFNKQVSIVEGILFINGDDGASIEELSYILEIKNDEEIIQIINFLISKYQNDKACGLDIQCFSKTKYRMIAKKENAEIFKQILSIKTETKLSSASIETISIIAYRGPITKAQVEEIRGVNCDAIFYKLKLRNLIKDVGKSQEIGRQTLYQVTDDFFKYFNISSLEELPKLKETIESEEKDIFDRK